MLEWMEQWLQTEWPDLHVYLTSVTEHWATFPVVGPRSRDVVGAVFPDVDSSNDAFPFMTWRDTKIGDVPVRLARGEIRPLSGANNDEIRILKEKHKELWKFYVLIDHDVCDRRDRVKNAAAAYVGIE